MMQKLTKDINEIYKFSVSFIKYFSQKSIYSLSKKVRISNWSNQMNRLDLIDIVIREV